MMKPKEPDKICGSCGKVILNGRSDRRYCDDVCRARATRERIRVQKRDGTEPRHNAVIRAIRRNYKLLKAAINGREEWIVDLETVYRKGFNRLVNTATEKLPNGKLRYYCFEIGWEELDKGRLLVTMNTEQLDLQSFTYEDSASYYSHQLADEN